MPLLGFIKASEAGAGLMVVSIAGYLYLAGDTVSM